MDEIRIVIDKKQARFVYSDDLVPLLEQGDSTIRRASHVEPAEGGWTADLTPSGGPVLGPFPLRSEALEKEIEWLNKNRL